MDQSRFQQELKFVNQIGQTLNIEERMKLELAILKITEFYKFDQICFWGRIEGVQRDYYIAMGIQYRGEYEFPKKKFFWATDSFNFAELPAYNNDYACEAEDLKDFFTGQHEKIVFKNQQNDIEVNLEDSLEIPKNLPGKNFSELERLSLVVNTVDYQCGLVPVGALKLTPTHEILVNINFKGLSLTEALKIENYQHFRLPLSEQKREFIGKPHIQFIFSARDDALFHPNFLDSIEMDYPNNQWSIQTDATKQNVTIRSLIWPGFIAYHRANTNIWGYAYFGDGIKNSDFEFII